MIHLSENVKNLERKTSSVNHRLLLEPYTGEPTQAIKSSCIIVSGLQMYFHDKNVWLLLCKLKGKNNARNFKE